MVLSTILNLFFIPVLYVILKTLLAKFSRKKVVARGGEVPPPQPTH
jgi:HAE1 family hydrophobic/amphiphilic exporter-1